MKRFQKKDIFTIPNIISYVRILLIPVFCIIYMQGDADNPVYYYIAAGVVLFSSFTDLFDGMIARKFNMVTELGKVLDPVADKLTHAALAFCIATKHPWMWALIALMVVKEGYMAIMGLKYLKKGKMLDGAKWFGKVCTAILFVGMLVLFLFYNIPELAANIIIGVMMLAMAITFIKYIQVYRNIKINGFEEK